MGRDGSGFGLGRISRTRLNTFGFSVEPQAVVRTGNHPVDRGDGVEQYASMRTASAFNLLADVIFDELFAEAGE